jgi:hypothetical protein
MIEQFKTLVNYIGDYWHYTNEDKRELWDSFKIDPEVVINALQDQRQHVSNLIELGYKYEV